MESENISALLSTTGQEYIDKFGVVAYIKHFYRVIGRKLEQHQLNDTAARVARSRAEAIAMCIIKK